MTNLLSLLFLGAWAWLGIFAAAGHRWAQHAFAAVAFTFAAWLVAVVLSGPKERP
jgi:hypothetical protein